MPESKSDLSLAGTPELSTGADGLPNADALARAATLLSDFSNKGIRLWIENDRLRCSAPQGLVDHSIRDALRAERTALIFLLRASESNQTARAPLSRDQPLALTLAQEALLPLARSRSADGVYNVPLALEVLGPVNQEALYFAVNVVLARHDSLRMYFPANEARPFLRPRSAQISPEETQNIPNNVDAIAEAVKNAIARPFDLERGPLWRYCTYTTASRTTVVLFVFHHLIFDGFSRDVFLTELAANYDGTMRGQRLQSSPAFQSSDFAAREMDKRNGPRAAAARDWFTKQFNLPVPSTALPTATVTHAVPSRMVTFSAGVVSALHVRAATLRVPPAALATAAGVLALHRVTGQERILVMVPFSNRDIPESLGIIGYLNRVLPVSIELAPLNTLADMISEVGRGLSETAAHGFLGVEDITSQPGLARTQLNRLMVSWQERRRSSLTFAGQETRELSFGRAAPDFDLSLQFEVVGETLQCRVDSAPGILDTDSQATFAKFLEETLRTVIDSDLSATISHAVPGLIKAAEVSELINENPCVKEVATAHDRKNGCLRAWIVLDEEKRISDSDLLDWLRERLGRLLPPIRLRTVPHLIRNADGSVDTDALSRALPSADHHVELPRTDIERAIAEIWRKVLWFDRPVGRNEDFRLLGGHSLLAVRMISDLEVALGQSISPSSLVKLSTVAALAAAIENADTANSTETNTLDPQIRSRLQVYTATWQGYRPFQGSMIVGRNQMGSRIPLFWCLQNETELDQIARYIGDDQPVFGMRSGHAIFVKSRENINQLARFYSTEIMLTAPSGPVLVGGNCQAAVIAFHVARYLVEAGREVAQLFLHEKMIPEPYSGRIALSFGRESTRNPFLVSRDPRAEYSPYYSGIFSIDIIPGRHGEFFREPNIFEFVSVLKRRRDESLTALVP